jgi:hypothetical protein
VALSNERPDVEAAKKRMSGAHGAAREIRHLPDCILPDEVVEEMATGLYQYRRGLLVLTDRRVVFIARGMFSGRIEELGFDSIQSVQMESSLLLASLVMYANGNQCRIDSMDKADAKRMATHIRARMTVHGRSAEPSAASGGTQHVVTLLKHLGELRDVGVLTPDEFQTKKSQLLTRL